jgi:hypothetical protein
MTYLGRTYHALDEIEPDKPLKIGGAVEVVHALEATPSLRIDGFDAELLEGTVDRVL